LTRNIKLVRISAKGDFMSSKVTQIIVNYPLGQKPNIIIPGEYKPYRFILGKDGKNPLVAICMNPSVANENTSDRTVNRVIHASEKLKFDGWFVVNVYPERATNAVLLEKFSKEVAEKNVKTIMDFLSERKITEVWGAWGDLKVDSLKKGKKMLLTILKEYKIKNFHFADTTKQGNPRHPLYLKINNTDKRYMEY
jgi:hypothetical protein